jgi:flagellar hook assembly protein FlgD
MKKDIYQIQLSLNGSKPRIWRRLVIASNILLADFHKVIQTLWEGDLQSGDHFFRWNGKNDNAVELTKGIYLINIKGGNVDITKKLIKL